MALFRLVFHDCLFPSALVEALGGGIWTAVVGDWDRYGFVMCQLSCVICQSDGSDEINWHKTRKGPQWPEAVPLHQVCQQRGGAQHGGGQGRRPPQLHRVQGRHRSLAPSSSPLLTPCPALLELPRAAPPSLAPACLPTASQDSLQGLRYSDTSFREHFWEKIKWKGTEVQLL